MVNYSYDQLGHLVGVDDGPGRDIARYDFDATGPLAKVRRDNVVVSTYTFDMAGQLTAVEHAKKGDLLAAARYELDTLGRRIAQTREDNSRETYGYDSTSQLTSVDYGRSRVASTSTSNLNSAALPRSEAFAYDPVGNRTQVGRVVPNAPTVTETYTTNNLNQYTKIDYPLLDTRYWRTIPTATCSTTADSSTATTPRTA